MARNGKVIKAGTFARICRHIYDLPIQKTLSLLIATLIVSSAVLIGILHALHILSMQQTIKDLQSAGPIGYELTRNNKRWLMSPVVASGVGRNALRKLEEVSSNSQKWGERCWVDGQPFVLVAVPYNPANPDTVLQLLADVLGNLECGNPGLNLELALTSFRPKRGMRDPSGRGRIAQVRNHIIEKYMLERHRFVFWLDSDLSVVPTNIITQLYKANPTGISAPLVLLDNRPRLRRAYHEGRVPTADALRGATFYDTAAFVQEGQSTPSEIGPDKYGRQRNYGTVQTNFPYFNVSVLRRNPQRAQRKEFKWPPRIPCDSVGTVYLIPTMVYRWRGTKLALRHYAHVMTEHFPVVHAAKYLLGLRVLTIPSVAVMHAKLPLYGEDFHGADFSRSMWPDLHGNGTIAGSKFSDFRIVAKTVIEHSMRTRQDGEAPFNGSPPDHEAVERCLETVLKTHDLYSSPLLYAPGVASTYEIYQHTAPLAVSLIQMCQQ